MKISIRATELVDGVIEMVSLVKHGANRSPFKIIKAEDPAPLWAGLLPELDKLQQRPDAPVSKESKTVTMIKDAMAGITAEPDRKSDVDKARKLEIAKLRHRLNGLNNQQLVLWESPQHPLFEKLDCDLTLAIEKCELELAVLSTEQQDDQMRTNSAFFRRGGTSSYSDATASDSAYDRRDSEMRKAESQIDLSPIVTQTDAEEVSKIDLRGIVL